MSEKEATSKPKIFIVGHHAWGTDISCTALTEDGEVLAGHVSSTPSWGRHDMGINSDWKREYYEAHYPEGYELVDLLDLSDDELANHTGYMDAYARNQALAIQGTKE